VPWLAIVVLLTGWPVGALLAGLVAAVVPGTLGRIRQEADTVARTEAVAAWTEMLRDTLAAAAGLEEAIAATATAAPEPIRPEVQRLGRRLDHGTLPTRWNASRTSWPTRPRTSSSPRCSPPPAAKPGSWCRC
jgi:hypothetical protein